MRFRIFYSLIFAIFAIVLSRLFFLQIIKGESLRIQSQRNAVRIIPQNGLRGKILDTNGVILAEDRVSLNIAIIPQDLKSRSATFSELSRILAESKESLELRFKSNFSAPFAPVVVAEDVDRERALLIGEKRNKLPGLIIEYEPKRNYNFGSVASHVLGYLGKPETVFGSFEGYGFSAVQNVGVSGIEKYLDKFLRGEDGGMLIEVDNRGRQINLVGVRTPREGKSVSLTIDIRIQKILQNLLENRRGAVILMDPSNGDIFALASSPTFDPNVFLKKRDNRLRSEYLKDSAAPLFDRAVSGQYPPGSVFKIITTLSGLTSKKINFNTHFFCPGHKTIGRRDFKCWSTHNDQDLRNAIIHSCNVYFFNVGLVVGAEYLSDYTKVFQLGKPTGIDLPNEVTGFIPSPRGRMEFSNQGWYQGDTANLSIGQGGLLLTPIQVLRMASAVANSGYLVKPHLVKEVAGKKIVYKRPMKIDIDPKFLDFLKQSMRGVVGDETGSARILEIPGLEICAKTGTAQVGLGRKHGWIAGFFPKDQPKVAFVVFLENCEGSFIAAMLARDLFKEMLAEKILPLK